MKNLATLVEGLPNGRQRKSHPTRAESGRRWSVGAHCL